LLVTCDRSVVSSWYTDFLHQYNWLPRYNWNIVESGVKHHKSSPLVAILLYLMEMYLSYFPLCMFCESGEILLIFWYTVVPLLQDYHFCNEMVVAVSCIGGGNRSTWRKPPARCKSLTNVITSNSKHIVHSVFLTQDMDFHRHLSWSFLVFFWSAREVVAYLVDIGGVVNYHCLNFLYITDKKKFRTENGIILYYLAILLEYPYTKYLVFRWKNSTLW
jgi:hypothetical protein